MPVHTGALLRALQLSADLLALPSFWLFAGIIFCVNVLLIPMRRYLPRLWNRWGLGSTDFIFRTAVYALIPALVFTVTGIAALPVLFRGKSLVPITVLLGSTGGIVRIATVLAGGILVICAIPPVRRKMGTFSPVLDSICLLVVMRFCIHHILYNHSAYLFESTLYDTMFPNILLMLLLLAGAFCVEQAVLRIVAMIAHRRNGRQYRFTRIIFPAGTALITQLVPLVLASQMIYAATRTIDATVHIGSSVPVPYSRYVELYFYAQVCEMIDAHHLCEQVAHSLRWKADDRDAPGISARLFDCADFFSPVNDQQVRQNNWRNVLLWYNTR